jgi:hypothetical protein
MGWPRSWSIMTGAFLRSGPPPSKACQGLAIKWWCPFDGIDCDRHEGNLSSALRVFVLGVYREAVVSDSGVQKPYNWNLEIPAF